MQHSLGPRPSLSKIGFSLCLGGRYSEAQGGGGEGDSEVGGHSAPFLDSRYPHRLQLTLIPKSSLATPPSL